MQQIAAFMLAFSFVLSAYGNDNKPVGTRSAAMGNASVMISDIWSVYHNQAGLANIRNYAFATYFSNSFSIKELGLRAFAGAVPTQAGTFGLSYSYFGYSQFNESKFGLAYAKKLGKKISMGIQLDYFNTKIADDYGNKGIVAGEIGIIANPVENLTIGAHIFNPWRAKYVDYNDERLPQIFRLGAGYNFSDKVLVTIESEKDLDKEIIFKAGIEYKIVKNLFLRTGISTNPVLNTFGIGFHFKNFTMDMAFSKHPVLDYTTHFGLSYHFNRK